MSETLGGLVADAPFDDLEGDVVLRTTDGVHFYVHKFLLSLVSPVFKDMFLLPEPNDGSQELFQNKPCVPVEEDSQSLFQVLSWCDPRVLSISQKAEHLQSALRLADKYDMKCIIQRLEKSMRECEELVNSSPIEIYVLAIQYGFKDLAKMAARASLSVPLINHPKTPALREISATALHNLYEYHLACSEAVRSYVDTKLWDGVEGHHHFKENNDFGYRSGPNCCTRHPVRSRWLAYFPNYMDTMKWELFYRPVGATIQDPRFQGTLQQSMSGCSACKDKSAAMTEFLKAVGIAIDSVVAQSLPYTRYLVLKMENTVPQLAMAGSPFEATEMTDVILQTPDGVQFHISRIILSLSLQFFKDMFTLPSPPKPNECKTVAEQKAPVIYVDDDSQELFQLLSWCHSQGAPSTDLDNLVAALRLASKYDMEHSIKRIGKLLQSSTEVVKREYFRVYAIAMHYQFWEVAKMAAQYTLEISINNFPDAKEFKLLSGADFQSSTSTDLIAS